MHIYVWPYFASEWQPHKMYGGGVIAASGNSADEARERIRDAMSRTGLEYELSILDKNLSADPQVFDVADFVVVSGYYE